MGLSIKYVTLFLANFYPSLPLSHFVTHPGTPPKVRHTSRTLLPIFSRPSTKDSDKSPLYKFSLDCSREVFVRGFCQRVFCLEDFVRGGFCPYSLLSEYICYNRKLNITLNFLFHTYDKIFYKCDVTCSLPLLSQTVTPYRTPSPSSVTYFMDGPYVSEEKLLPLQLPPFKLLLGDSQP